MYFQESLVFIKQNMILVMVWFFLLIMVFYTSIMHHIQKYFEISCDTAILLINRKNAIVIDTRGQDEYYSGYIINSINIPFSNKNSNTTLEYKKIKDNPLILIHDQKSSLFIKKHFSKLGFTEIYVLKGGIDSWKSHNLPVLLKK